MNFSGENVSTTDVEAVIQNHMNLTDCTVFGVSVGNCEGKAGMAVINAKNKEIDFKQLAHQLIQRLPSYAIPLFIRITDSVELTGTYKLIKYNLRKVGYNPELTDDQIYFLDRSNENYIPLDSKLYQMIESGQIRL
jgi:acyl-CoA synthetase (AMP-forming)/AMP-acid ligase II